MPGALHVLVAYHTLVLHGLSSPKTWSGKVKAKGSTSSARMLPTQATESAGSHAHSQSKKTPPVTWKRAKNTPRLLMWRPPSGNPKKPGCVISATPAKHNTIATPTALQRIRQ